MPSAHLDRLRAIKSLPQLAAYLRDELDWPIAAEDADEITFDYTPADLGLDAQSAVRIREIKQLRPLASGQPWGIFFVNFEKKRLPVVLMRRILRALVLKKRTSANKSDRSAWAPSDLLFISAYGEDTDRAITFAHFADPLDVGLAELRVLGWDDDDTPLKLDYVAHALREKLRWDGALARDPAAWRKRWAEAFVIRHGHVIRTSAELAGALALLARRIRSRIGSILRMEAGDGQIRTLQRAFQIGLIHDLNDDTFADMFAQTVTYGLFSVSVRRTFPGMGSAVTKGDVPDLIFTSPFLKEMLGIFLGLKSYRGKIDFDELGVSDVTDLLTSPDTHMEVVLADFNNKTRGEDPVIHFYEHFLSAYNKQLKIQRGVFYTPQPVVSYIVRSVHELLQTEFGLADGLADTTTWGAMLKKHPGLKLPPLTDEPGEQRTISPDEPFVQILDPATGTATFLVEVIDVIHRTLAAKWKQQRLTDAQQRAAWNDYVPQHLLPRLHAFELMMAPYAIAHMKIGLKLAETGYRFGTEERARIYLTNALEPKVKQLPQIGFDALAHEAEAVNEIKWYKRFTVVIGNPPYSGISSNMSEYAQRIVDAYRVVDGAALNEKKLWLQDDYVKFIRKAQTTIETARAGVFGFISNHGYLDNPTFRGMRQSLMGTYQQMSVLDLHGNANKKEESPNGSEDKNVFDIRQGVAICLATRGGTATGIKHADLWGSRESKYAWLTKQQVDWMVDWPRPELTRHLDIRGNKALITTRITQDIFSVFVSHLPPAHKSVSAYDVNYVFPLTTAPSSGAQRSLLFDDGKQHPNFAPAFLKALAGVLQLPQTADGLARGLTPEDIFHYAYAVFHSPGYRSRYAEFLKIDFPRLPLTGNLELFRALARLGGELTALHLLEFEVGTPLRGVRAGGHTAADGSESRPYQPLTEFVGGRNPEVEKVGWTPDGGGTVWLDANVTRRETHPGTTGFKGVPKDVWQFPIGGYQVCEKWLKDRKGRTLTNDDIAHYHKIVVALSETIRLMAEIDQVIEKHGGWPGAFTAQPVPPV